MSGFITVNDLKWAILDLAARRRYRLMYGPQEWEDGSEKGHAEAREATTADDVATVAAILWSNDGVRQSMSDFGSATGGNTRHIGSTAGGDDDR